MSKTMFTCPFNTQSIKLHALTQITIAVDVSFNNQIQPYFLSYLEKCTITVCHICPDAPHDTHLQVCIGSLGDMIGHWSLFKQPLLQQPTLHLHGVTGGSHSIHSISDTLNQQVPHPGMWDTFHRDVEGKGWKRWGEVVKDRRERIDSASEICILNELVTNRDCWLVSTQFSVYWAYQHRPRYWRWAHC